MGEDCRGVGHYFYNYESLAKFSKVLNPCWCITKCNSANHKMVASLKDVLDLLALAKPSTHTHTQPFHVSSVNR